MLNKLKPKSEFSRNVLMLMTGTTIAQAIPIAISPILTRIYTPEDFGVFALYIGVVSLFVVVASARYEMALMLPEKDEGAINLFALGMIILFITTTILSIITIIFHDLLLNVLDNKEISPWIYFMPISVFFVGLFNLLSYYNNRMKLYRDIAQATIMKSIVLAMVQLIVGFLKQGATGLVGGQIISSLFSNIQLGKNILKDKELLLNIRKKNMISLAIKYKDFPKYQAPHAMLNTFSSQIPVYIFTPFFGLTVVGLYALSTRIVFAPLMILAGASAKVYNQKVTEVYNNKGDAYGFTVRLLKSLIKKIIVPFVLLVIFAPNIFAFIFGEAWRDAGVYTQILSPWLLMVFVVATISFIPSLLNMQKRAFMLEILYTILRVIAIAIGLVYQNILIALVAYSVVSFLMLNYNMWWMLSSLKKVD